MRRVTSINIQKIYEMKQFSFTPQGVCSRQIDIELDGETVSKVSFTGGCDGNLQGIAKLIEGMSIDQVVERLKGIDCKGRGTSCPDQLAEALQQGAQ